MLGWAIAIIALAASMITSPIWIPIAVFFSLILAFWLAVIYAGLRLFGYWEIVYQKGDDLYEWLIFKSDKPRKIIWKSFYNLLCRFTFKRNWKVMNYGYAEHSEKGHIIDLDPEEETERYQYQMYHYIASGLKKFQSLSGKHILEVGSGRGGGLAYITKVLSPISAVGIDYSQTQIDWCNKTYNIPNLKFAYGDAEHLPVHDSCVDIVINIESSHCYGNLKAFVEEVKRVLKPGGHFLIADFIDRQELALREDTLNSCGLQLIERKDITENVILALNLDEKRKINSINSAPKIFRKILREFAGTENSRMSKSFNAGNTGYIAYHFMKPKSSEELTFS
ncbi:unnamed protein product [Blepharisma stoltei]|uniref:Methyltransferase type 11 domain-containing protein n=1 Tax=Blepharisma stoltei TaxID=1481888 RepID=A0AAU9JVW7_9CILI|nr:unnamed protein product [Blepharisma stoltei]